MYSRGATVMALCPPGLLADNPTIMLKIQDPARQSGVVSSALVSGHVESPRVASTRVSQPSHECLSPGTADIWKNAFAPAATVSGVVKYDTIMKTKISQLSGAIQQVEKAAIKRKETAEKLREREAEVALKAAKEQALRDEAIAEAIAIPWACMEEAACDDHAWFDDDDGEDVTHTHDIQNQVVRLTADACDDAVTELVQTLYLGKAIMLNVVPSSALAGSLNFAKPCPDLKQLIVERKPVFNLTEVGLINFTQHAKNQFQVFVTSLLL